MPDLLSTASELAGEAVDAVRGILIDDEEFEPVSRPCLPSQDSDPGRRAEWLADARARWQWDHSYVEGMALLDEGDTANPTIKQALTPNKHIPREAHPPIDYIPRRAASLTELALSVVRERFAEGLEADKGHVTDLDTYNRIVRAPLKLPETCERWREDAVFAWQRVAGANPLVIQKVTTLPHHIPLTDAQLKGVWRDGLVLEDELAAGNVFMTDYTIMEAVSTTSDDSGTRQVWPVVGLFHVDRSADEHAPLQAIAIHIGMSGNPLQTYTPNDGVRWDIAKSAHQCADITLHEMGTHLGRAHFALETIVVAAYRNLAHNHPLMVLFQPHFRIVVFNNFEGRELLVNPGGKVDQLMAGGVASQLHLVMVSVDGFEHDTDGSPQTKHWTFENFDLPIDLDVRGVKDIPNYPYAEDGMDVWNAIHTFVSEYLDLYYNDDHAVQNDTEVQAWLAEMRDEKGGMMKGVPDVHTKEMLARVATRVIFASGPQHSAVNYAQYECAASASNMPLALYRALPWDLRNWTDERAEAFHKEMLPPIEKAKEQLSTIVELTSFHYDQLGHYKEGDFKDELVEPIIQRFKETLAALDHTIEVRNSKRLVDYPFLQPKHILNSTSI